MFRARGRSIFCVLILLALLARAAIPAGFMPVMEKAAVARVAMMICTGSGPATIMVDPGKFAAPGHDQKEQGAKKHAPCPFAPVLAQDMPGFISASAAIISYRAEVFFLSSVLPVIYSPKAWHAQGPPSFSA
jgi:hypothetical protein